MKLYLPASIYLSLHAAIIIGFKWHVHLHTMAYKQQ